MEKRMRLQRAAVLTVPVSDVQKLLAEASESAALLYLYLLNNDGLTDEAAAAASLRMTREELTAAVQILVRLGILDGTEPTPAPAPRPENKPLPSAPELQEVDTEDIVRRTKDSPEWTALLDETQNVFGRKLSTAEVKTLFGIYDQIGLPVEVIMLLEHYCAEQNEKRYGSSRKSTIRFMEKEAFRWAELELMSCELAEEWIRKQDERQGRVGEVMQALQLYGREPTATERGYIESWLGAGFTVEALAEARERTVTNTGALKWKYMDGIVRSWDGKGLHTLAEIKTGDKKGEAPAASEPVQGPTAEEFARMKKLREKVRNG